MFTSITRAAMQGKTAERDMSDRRNLVKRKKDRANNTKPARTRDGAKHPGGRFMRRSLGWLGIRQTGYVEAAHTTKPGSRKG